MFEIASFGMACNGDVGGDHVGEMRLWGLQKGREKSESFFPFPTVALPGAKKGEEVGEQSHCCMENIVLVLVLVLVFVRVRCVFCESEETLA